jgi:DNA repair exonuclease SbcCD nuclease subunit
MTVRFLHAADIHLDSPLTGLTAYGDAPLDALRSATRRAFEGLVDLAIEERVDFVIVAGDLFDGSWKDYNTGLFFVAQMGRLKQARIRVVLLYGNHDAECDLTAGARLRFPNNVSVFPADRAESIRFDDLNVVLHGRSFWQRDVAENLVRTYPDPAPGWFNVGVLHTALSGREGHASYAPCSIEDLRLKGYEYWALGHVHDAEIVCDNPHVVFPGSLQGRHVREVGPHGAYLVEIDGTKVKRLTRVTSDVLRWQVIELDLAAHGSLGEILSCAETAFGSALDEAEGRPLAIRVLLRGQTKLHAELFRREAHLRAELQALALGFGPGRIWIEKVRVQAESTPAENVGTALGDVLSDLNALMAEAPTDPEFLAAFERELAELAVKLPPEVRRSGEPMLELLREGRHADMIRAIAPSLVAQVAER